MDKFSTTKPIIKTFTEITTWDETASSLLTSQASLEDNTITPETIRTENTLPTSCCKNKCKSYYTRGCFKILYNDIARVVFMVKSVSMITSVLQVRGKPLFNVDSHFAIVLMVNNFRCR